MFLTLRNEGKSFTENEEYGGGATDLEKDGETVAYLLGQILGRLRHLHGYNISAGAEIQMWQKSGHKIISSGISLTLNI